MTPAWLLLFACTSAPTPADSAASDTDSAEPGEYSATVDPAPSDSKPDWGDAVGIVHVSVRTADASFAHTDDDVKLCMGSNPCLTLDDPDWTDFGNAALDVTSRENAAWSRAALGDPSLAVTGSNAWKPACLAVSLDGQPVHCRTISDVTVEEDPWTDPAGLGIDCRTCEGSVLTHGPLLGASESDAVRLWYRTDATREVSVRFARHDEDLASKEPLTVRWPRAERDFTDELVVRGLTPNTAWTWDLTIEGETFGPFTAKTAPVTGRTGVTRIAFGSCTKADEQPLFEQIVAWNPDLFIFAGDSHYGNTADRNATRSWWRWAHEREHRRDLIANVPSVMTWDDHDFVDNNSDGTFPGIPTARRVVGEYTANTTYGENGEGIYSAYSFADVDVFLVDARTWRNVDGYIGAAQRAWLEQGLRSSTANVKLLVSGTQFVDSALGESWTESPEDRAAVLSWAAEVPGVVLLSGDIHRSEFSLVAAPDGTEIPEITSSPIATWNSPCGTGGDRIACLSADNFVGLEITTGGAEPTVTASMIDEEGTVRETWTFSP